jgi:hypothetical protein
MPGFVDRAIINGKVQEIVWMPSLYPPRRSADESEGGGGGGQISSGLSLRTGLLHTQNLQFFLNTKPTCRRLASP